MTYWLSFWLESVPNFPLSSVSSSVRLATLRDVTLRWSTVVCGIFRYHVSAFRTLYNQCSSNSNAKQHIIKWIRNFKITVLLNVTPCSLVGRCQRYGRIFWLHRQGFFLFGTLVTTYQNARRSIPQYNSPNFRDLYNIKRHTRNLQFPFYIKTRPEHVRPEFSYPRLDVTDIFGVGTVLKITFFCAPRASPSICVGIT